MTEEVFMSKNRVSKKTMKEWKEKCWIRGAHVSEDGSYYIPEGAIKPYARRSTKIRNTSSMYVSLIHGISKGQDVFPELYDMHPDRFAVFINKLIEMDYIQPLEIDGVTYYTPLPNCLKCNELTTSKAARYIQQSLNELTKAAAEGMTSILFAS